MVKGRRRSISSEKSAAVTAEAAFPPGPNWMGVADYFIEGGQPVFHRWFAFSSDPPPMPEFIVLMLIDKSSSSHRVRGGLLLMTDMAEDDAEAHDFFEPWFTTRTRCGHL